MRMRNSYCGVDVLNYLIYNCDLSPFKIHHGWVSGINMANTANECNIDKLEISKPVYTTLCCNLQNNLADFAEQVALPLVTMTTQNPIKDQQSSHPRRVVSHR